MIRGINTKGDDAAAYYSYLDDGPGVVAEEVNTADAPTQFRPGYDGNVGSHNEIAIRTTTYYIRKWRISDVSHPNWKNAKKHRAMGVALGLTARL